VRLMGAWHLPKPDEGRVDEADPPPWRGIYPKLDTPEAIPAARDADDIIVTLSVVGAGFVCATHKLDSGLPKSRRGSAEPKSRSGSVDNGGGVGRRGTVGFSGRRGSGAGLAPATAPAAAPAPASDEEEAAEKALLAQHRHLWCSSVVYGNGFLAAWHGSDNRGEKAVLLASQPSVAALRICVYACRTAPYAHKQMQAPRTLPSVDALKEKMLSEHKPQLIATATLPFATLAGGVRSVQLRHPRGEPIALCKMLVDVSSLPNVAVPTLPTFDASEPSVEPSVEQPTLASKLLRRASLGKVMGKSKPDLLKAPSASPVGRIFDRKRSTFGNLRLSSGSRASLREASTNSRENSRGSRGSVSGGRPSVINSDGEGSNSRGSVSALGSDADAEASPSRKSTATRVRLLAPTDGGIAQAPGASSSRSSCSSGRGSMKEGSVALANAALAADAASPSLPSAASSTEGAVLRRVSLCSDTSARGSEASPGN